MIKQAANFLKILFVVSILFILGMQTVSAWGVLPAKQLADFLTQEQELEITIRNNNFDEGFFKVSFAGNLEPYLEYENKDTLVYISPEETQKTIFLTLHITEELTPGKNVGKIILQQVSAQATSETVSSTLTLVAEVVVNVPYEGNHVLAQTEIGQVGMSEEVPFSISLLNKGDSPIQVWADISIKGPTNLEIDSWSTEKKMLAYLAADKIETYWRGEKQPGLYFAEIQVHHGDKVQTLRKEFVVGEEEVKITAINVANFVLGEINKLELVAKNNWNAPLTDVFAELFVLTEEGQTVQSFKSNPESFGPYETKNILAYWDTSNLVVGKYVLQTVVHVAESSTQAQFPVTVAIDKLNFAAAGRVTGNDQTSESNSSGNLTSILIILLIVVVVTNIVIIMYFRKSKK